MCKYCQNPVIDRDGGFWMEYQEMPIDNCGDSWASALITTSGPSVYLEIRGKGYGVSIEINNCPICGRELEEK